MKKLQSLNLNCLSGSHHKQLKWMLIAALGCLTISMGAMGLRGITAAQATSLSQGSNSNSEVHRKNYSQKHGQPQVVVEVLLLITSLITSFVLAHICLSMIVRFGSSVTFSWTSQLLIVLPEECVAELEVLHQRLKSQEYASSLTQVRMLKEILYLLVAFHVFIRLENFKITGEKNIKDDQPNK